MEVIKSMKKKTINKTLMSVHKSLCESITDKKVRKLVENNTIITGGCITSMLLQEEVNDYDLYFRNKETVSAVANYYVNKLRQIKTDNGETVPILFIDDKTDRVRIIVSSAGVAAVGKDGSNGYFEQYPDEDNTGIHIQPVFESLKNKGGERYQPMLITSNAITLSNKVQLVLRFYGEPEEIHKNYDFVHVTNYWTSWNKEVITNKEALECILTRELKYIGSLYPLCSMIRLRKFIKRGWSVHAGQMLKIAFQISGLNLNDINVLEEQLTGVDFSYFREVINILKNNKNRAIDETYLAEIVDRIFDK